MGWVWRDDEDDDQLHTSPSEFGSPNPPSAEPSFIRKIVKSRCTTEEVHPGKFVRKCEKTHQILRETLEKPVEVVESNKEYTEDDVTEEVLKGGGSSRFGSSGDGGVLDFPGLRNDMEALEQNIIGGLSRFFEAAQDMKNGFSDVLAKASRIFDGEASSSSSSTSMRRGIPIDEYPRQEVSPKQKDHQAFDAKLSALAKDV